MAQDIIGSPEYAQTMQKLEQLKRISKQGTDYWKAREINLILGYPAFDKFQPVIERAREALIANNVDDSHHIARTSKLMGGGKGSQREGVDYFLTRAACYLIAMNGDSSKPQIAAAQAYFAVQTRRMEETDMQLRDEKRLELRDKVSGSMKRVSAVAQEAGVASRRQGIFHEQRYLGLYDARSSVVKELKGLAPGDNLFDRAGPLELSAHDFQMNLAADIISKDKVRGEKAAIETNLQVAKRVRKTIKDSGGTLPEVLPLEEHISDVRKRITGKRTKSLSKPRPSK